jgi:hypothetical protein
MGKKSPSDETLFLDGRDNMCYGYSPGYNLCAGAKRTRRTALRESSDRDPAARKLDLAVRTEQGQPRVRINDIYIYGK